VVPAAQQEHEELLEEFSEAEELLPEVVREEAG
jgi:hypothetical protein